MKSIRSDIYFAADDAHTFLPWLIGIMVFLATLLMCLGISVNSWVTDSGSDYSNQFTVNIPANTENIDKKTLLIQKSLKKIKAISSYRQISRDEIGEMLRGWLGNMENISDLPLPIIYEVTLKTSPSTAIDYEKLQAELEKDISGIEIDTHQTWVLAFASLSAAVQSLSIILALLVIGGIGVMIAFTSRAALSLHSKTVKLLHSIGAEDNYIALLFQMETFRLVLPGATIGAIIACAAYFLAGQYISSLDSSIMPSIELGKPHYILLILMPIACTLVAWFVSRYAVTHQLERSL